MGILRLFIIAATFSFVLLANAYATDWYVSASGTGAKNGTSEENAFAQNSGVAWDSIHPGDTLYIIGTITTLKVGASGSSSNGYVTISGHDNTSCVNLGEDKAYTDFSGPDEFGTYSVAFAGSGKGAAEWTTTNGITAGWNVLTDAGKVPDGDWVAGNYYTDTTNDIFYWKPLNGTVTGKTVTIEAGTDIDLNEQSWVKLASFNIYGGSVLILDSASTNVWLDNLYIDGLDAGTLIMLGTNDFRLSNSTIKNGVEGLWNYNGTEANVVIDHNTFQDFRGANDSHCIGIYDGGTNWIIEHNDLSLSNTGITAYNGTGDPLQNIIIRHNYVHDTDGTRSSGGTGFNRGYGIGFEGSPTDTAKRTGNWVYGNIVQNCVGNTSFGINVHFPKGAENYVLNNTVRNCGNNYYISYTAGQPGGTFKNNISIDPVSGTNHIYANANADQTGLDIDYNVYYPNTGTLFYLGSAKNFTDWKTAIAAASISGADAHSSVSDPLLLNGSGTYSTDDDFKIGAGSPGLNAGTAVSGLHDASHTDYWGTTLNASYVDIGAYQHPVYPQFKGVQIGR